MGYHILDYDIELVSEFGLQNCLTCNYRSEQSFCVIAGDYVGEINRCSEWESKYAK